MSQDRIEFYEQVLELEPASKLFFTLARLYFDHNDLEKARKVLESGLEKHPEHIQAKLLLASVMERAGDLSAARGVYREIFDRVFNYPEFWAGVAAGFREEGRSEPALAAAFLSSWIADHSLTWSRVFQNGLDSLKGPDTSSVSPDEPVPAQPQPEPDETGAVTDTGQAEAANQELSVHSTDSKDLPEPGEENLLEPLEATGADTWAHEPKSKASGQDTFDFSGPENIPGEEPGIVEHEEELQELDPENISWEEEFDEPEEVEDIKFEDDARTRSMADLLAAQEEYQKALDIYKELWVRSLPGPERQEIEGIISRLSQTPGLGDEPDQAREYGHEPIETEEPLKPEAASPEAQPDETSPADAGQDLDSQKASPGETLTADAGETEKSTEKEAQEKKELMSFLSRLADRLDKKQ